MNVLVARCGNATGADLEFTYWRDGMAFFHSESVQWLDIARAVLSVCAPDVIVFEGSSLNGAVFDAAKQMRSASPGTKLLFVCEKADQFAAYRALAAGGDGILIGRQNREELAYAISEILSGAAYIGTGIFTSNRFRRRFPRRNYLRDEKARAFGVKCAERARTNPCGRFGSLAAENIATE